jgi:hypothetical protein
MFDTHRMQIMKGRSFIVQQEAAPSLCKKNYKSSIMVGVLWFFLLPQQVLSAVTSCHPLLWPESSSVIHPINPVSVDILNDLTEYANRLLKQPSHALPLLSSSGKIDINDSTLLSSRLAFQDADKAAVLALTYKLTNDARYFDKARKILIKWAAVNKPTGNPIDETRLEGMIWAYDLIACSLSTNDKKIILKWFEKIYIKKSHWHFGDKTSINNYRVHQLKMLLLLDKVLKKDIEWQQDKIMATEYAMINLNPSSGVSVDYVQRGALYYHNYVMQPWLEIVLITNCCQQPVSQGFYFLREKILSHAIGNEFLHSQADIDALRAQSGFVYAKQGGVFDVSKAATTIVEYYTLDSREPNSELWAIQQRAKVSPWMIFLKARRMLWKN